MEISWSYPKNLLHKTCWYMMQWWVFSPSILQQQCHNSITFSIPRSTISARADPASKFRGGGDFSNIWQSSHYGFSTVREVMCTSQLCCDKTTDGKMVLHRECCFPNCTKSWWIKLLSLVLGGGAIAPIAPPLSQCIFQPISSASNMGQNTLNTTLKLLCLAVGSSPLYWLKRENFTGWRNDHTFFETRWVLRILDCYWYVKLAK